MWFAALLILVALEAIFILYDKMPWHRRKK